MVESVIKIAIIIVMEAAKEVVTENVMMTVTETFIETIVLAVLRTNIRKILMTFLRAAMNLNLRTSAIVIAKSLVKINVAAVRDVIQSKNAAIIAVDHQSVKKKFATTATLLHAY